LSIDQKFTMTTPLSPGIRQRLVSLLAEENGSDLSALPLAELIAFASRKGYPVSEQSEEEIKSDLDTLEEWIGKCIP